MGNAKTNVAKRQLGNENGGKMKKLLLAALVVLYGNAFGQQFPIKRSKHVFLFRRPESIP